MSTDWTKMGSKNKLGLASQVIPKYWKLHYFAHPLLFVRSSLLLTTSLVDPSRSCISSISCPPVSLVITSHFLSPSIVLFPHSYLSLMLICPWNSQLFRSAQLPAPALRASPPVCRPSAGKGLVLMDSACSHTRLFSFPFQVFILFHLSRFISNRYM